MKLKFNLTFRIVCAFFIVILMLITVSDATTTFDYSGTSTGTKSKFDYSGTTEGKVVVKNDNIWNGFDLEVIKNAIFSNVHIACGIISVVLFIMGLVSISKKNNEYGAAFIIAAFLLLIIASIIYITIFGS